MGEIAREKSAELILQMIEEKKTIRILGHFEYEDKKRGTHFFGSPFVLEAQKDITSKDLHNALTVLLKMKPKPQT